MAGGRGCPASRRRWQWGKLNATAACASSASARNCPDLVTDRLVVEAKFRDKIAAQRWLEQCEGYAAAYPGRIPVCFARERRDSRPIAILRLEDFLDLILEAKKAALATDKTEG
jgi:hypothetical protein